MLPVLETPRLVLRPFGKEDAAAVFAIYSDEETNTFLPWFPAKTAEDAAALCARHAEESFSYAVCPRGEAPVGYVHLSGRPPYDLGYALLPASRGKGYAAEACAAVLSQARESGIRYVTATHDVENPASGRVMRRIGMTYRYSYEELWQPKARRVTFRLFQIDLADGVPEYDGYKRSRLRWFREEL